MSDTMAPGTPVPGPECARYAHVLPALAQSGADADTLAQAHSHAVGCAYCSAWVAAYDALDAALAREYGSASRQPALDSVAIMRMTPVDESHAASDGAGEPPSDARPRHTRPPRRSSRRLADLMGIAAAVLIVLAVTTLILSHAGFAPLVGPGVRTPVASVTPPAQPTVSPTTASGAALSFRSVHMVSSTTGWATMSDGGVTRTTDGGVHWTDVTPQGADLRENGTSLGVISGSEVWMADIQSPCTRIRHTTDGGQSWTSASVPLPAGVTNGVALCGAPIFVDAQHGWLMEGLGVAAGSEGVAIFRTLDGGATWSEVSAAMYNNTAPSALPFSGDKTGIAFANASTGWVTGTSPAPGFWLYVTHDGGRTWSQQTLPPPPGTASQMQAVTNAPVFFSAMDGVLPVQVDQSQGAVANFYVTHDGGQTWTPTHTVPSAQVSLWSFTDASHWWALAGDAILVSTDEGQTWTTIRPGGTFNNSIISFDMVTSAIGYAVVMDDNAGTGSLIKTTDGGHSWARVPATSSGAPACQPNQLALQLRTGGFATGNDTGELLVRNISPSVCSLQGKVDFYGVDAQGKRIAGSRMNQPQTLAPMELPPNTPAVPPGAQEAPGAYLVMGILGAYRDDPSASNGLCSAANEVTPSQLVLVVGSVTLQVANYDPAGGTNKSMYGCHGVILGEGVSLSS